MFKNTALKDTDGKGFAFKDQFLRFELKLFQW